MSSVAEVLLDRWRHDGIRPLPGCSEEDLRRFEDKWSVRLPDDLRAYYSLSAGMPSAPVQDAKGFYFCPLSRVRTVREEYADLNPPSPPFPGAEDMFVFADYLQWSWAYAIKISKDPASSPVFVLGGEKPVRIASSFNDFIHLYLAGDDSLYGGSSTG